MPTFRSARLSSRYQQALVQQYAWPFPDQSRRYESASEIRARVSAQQPFKGEPFPFMKLPIEIRMMFYEYYVRPVNVIVYTYGENTYFRHEGVVGASRLDHFRHILSDPTYSSTHPHACGKIMNLLQTSPIICDEASRVFFNKTRFDFESTDCLRAFLDPVPNHLLRLITSVSISNEGRKGVSAMRLLVNHCTGLRRLHVSITDTSQLNRNGLMKMPGLGDLLKLRDIEELTMKHPKDMREIDHFFEALEIVTEPRVLHGAGEEGGKS